jgi:hypothetical protein
VQYPYFREKGMKVFLCRNPKTNIQEVYIEKSKTEKIKLKRKL